MGDLVLSSIFWLDIMHHALSNQLVWLVVFFSGNESSQKRAWTSSYGYPRLASLLNLFPPIRIMPTPKGVSISYSLLGLSAQRALAKTPKPTIIDVTFIQDNILGRLFWIATMIARCYMCYLCLCPYSIWYATELLNLYFVCLSFFYNLFIWLCKSSGSILVSQISTMYIVFLSSII